MEIVSVVRTILWPKSPRVLRGAPQSGDGRVGRLPNARRRYQSKYGMMEVPAPVQRFAFPSW
jgi:hypothetical protein